MKNENLARMIKLADEFFETKNDPMQISVNGETRTMLKRIHPSTMTEKRNKKGPIAWAMVIPTTGDLMKQFTSKKISEQELLYNTPLRKKYNALYLCSALVLPEYRGKGVAKRLVVKAVKAIRVKHPIEFFFYWEFSVEGKKLAVSIAKEFALPLYKRKS
jgi:Acetyltransferase (GNAT) family.